MEVGEGRWREGRGRGGNFEVVGKCRRGTSLFGIGLVCDFWLGE